ncbi:MAG: M20/M25/M40 family metallo-hydrolase, partial [Terriglobales bacterium]
MRALQQHCTNHLADTTALLRQLVESESPTGDKTAAGICARMVAHAFARRRARITLHPQSACGPFLEARFSTTRNQAAPVLLLGHYDTVWDVGTLARHPWRVQDGRIYGPGIFDMKGGIALMISALDALIAVHEALPRPVIVALSGDEEAGSAGSRPIIEALAKECAVVLVLEPAQGTAVKTARKGVGSFKVQVAGVAAHAGLDFANGQNAIVELARQVQAASAFTDLERGLTVSVGHFTGGGSAVNVVPAHAEAVFDVRIKRLQDGPDIEQQFRSLQTFNPKCQLQVTGGINRPPLERTPAVAALYEKAEAIASELGFELGEAAVGGGS